ncbi:MAG: PilZ domain-containing protein [Novosphingobium sp.]|nr:PilZ domain-containing protein [Novosphingobium sp.]
MPEPCLKDQRRSERLPIVLKARWRMSSWQVGDAVLANVSPEGCCITVARATLKVGQQVVLRAGSMPRLPGRVRWVRDTSVGIEFDHALDHASLAGMIAWADAEEAEATDE